ncbi:MAG: flagellar basal body rod protein FlgC [Planctomycetes bacterium]|nr:flagellar basal body rod protein FlgC [Planctomycetota bacterium]MCB9909976.1 flagellar basal body rod protein FlgC [Planctomycetota bacterium]HPF12710.1 flagellar basal body rod protein FlgC [Planctomycetota bacterium]HRV80619.1 flagellar basal body rod protein FlgC [Planctomycetota bacterium]
MAGIQRIFQGMHTASTALKAERARVDIIAQNIAQANTTRMPDTGEPYRREVVNFAPIYQKGPDGTQEVGGVRVSGVTKDYTTPFEVVHDPAHPDADADGNVLYPNVNTIKEMAELITALRAYEANIQVADSFERMAQRGLKLAE